MKFQTKPVQVEAYKVDSPEGRDTLERHTNAFESRNLWDCWEIRTPDDRIELVTRNDWVMIDRQGGIRPIKPQELMDNYIPLSAPTHCLRCGNPTGYEGIAALPTGQEDGLCSECINLLT